MTEKIFEGQYSGEKILLRTHPSLAFFFFQKFDIFIIYIIISFLVAGIGFWLQKEIFGLYSIVAIGIFLVFFWHFFTLYKNARYTFTSRRCIYFVKKSLFKRSYREIHLVDLRTAVPKKSGLFGLIFGYGTLILTDKDENQIFYHGIREHKYISRYLGRIVDYIKIHGHTDELSAYQTRKIRKQQKNS